ncbi:class A beta-lactamase [Nitratireductor indicus]|uniref:class A beta-lactamase n=1 Tax=Nitratireductor indicus TaxID=721133 RepID=UPI0028743F9D|nr:class A beta-lactamase [Nitratireductor indicus]MDS1135888.1 class A beta-lactamase [Nitratireductor indicus]
MLVSCRCRFVFVYEVFKLNLFQSDISRRSFFSSCGASIVTASVFLNRPSFASSGMTEAFDRKFIEVEAWLGGRLGVAIEDVQTGQKWSYRSTERFPMNSTFKAFACAAILARADAGKEDLSRRIVFQKEDLVTWSPVTEKHVGGRGMTLHELCAAASTMSDNTAANLLIDALGGPRGWTDFMRSIGDDVSRLDRKEPDLTEGTPGDPRDTTSPDAFLESLKAAALGNVLSPASRSQFIDWLVDNRVSRSLLRAGVPKDWKVGDRTGAGGHATRGITAIMWPPKRKPLIATIFVTETRRSMEDRDAAIAEIGRFLSGALEG